jgi:hypothetical protein
MPVNHITISGNLSLSKRIVRQPNPLSFYASSTVGEWRKKIKIKITQKQKEAMD